jgi:hypothetical protein
MFGVVISNSEKICKEQDETSSVKIKMILLKKITSHCSNKDEMNAIWTQI